MMAEQVLVRCPCGGKVCLIGYMDKGRLCYDLHTDGRVLITPAIARKLARKLLEFAPPVLAQLNSARPKPAAVSEHQTENPRKRVASRARIEHFIAAEGRE